MGITGIVQEFVDSKGFEHRNGQEDMAVVVDRAMRHHQPAIIEGGTGNGKTFAYLIPMLEFLHSNPQAKAAISSATITLQDQVVGKDLPDAIEFFKEKYGDEFKITMADVAKLVGSGNYTCEDDAVFDKGGSSQKSAIVKDALGEDNFNLLKEMAGRARQNKAPILRRDLNFKIPYDIWEEVGCTGVGGCRCHEKGSTKKCAYKTALGEIEDTRIVVTNHSYLAMNSYFALAGRGVVVVDEAHKLPDVLSKKASKDINLTRFLKTLETTMECTKNGSVIPELNNAYQEIYSVASGFHRRTKEITDCLLKEFALAKKSAIKMSSLGNIGIDKPHQITSYILTGAVDADVDQRANVKAVTKFSHVAERGKAEIRDLYGEVRQSGDKAAAKAMGVLQGSLSSAVRFVEEIENLPFSSSMPRWLQERKLDGYGQDADKNARGSKGAGNVVWFEKGTRNVSVLRAPINHRLVQRMESKAMFEATTPIFVSATLSTSDNSSNFEHFKRELGFDNRSDIIELKVPSQFDWQKQTKLIIPADIPQPSYSRDTPGQLSAETKEYYDAVAKSICGAAKEVDGNSLVLCSSVTAVDLISKHIEAADKELVVLNQANGLSIERMLHKMRQGVEPKKVFVGMQTLWQGIDLQGDALRGLFIVKIPFATPNHPLAEERKNMWQEVFKKPFFTDYVLPEAKTMLRQGVGRLIRNGDAATEYGVVVCYDPKFAAPPGARKSYMKEIESVFPQAMWGTLERPAIDEVKNVVAEFFEAKRLENTEGSAPEVKNEMAVAI